MYNKNTSGLNNSLFLLYGAAQMTSLGEEHAYLYDSIPLTAEKGGCLHNQLT